MHRRANMAIGLRNQLSFQHPFANTDMALMINGDWQVEDNWDRMSIPLLGYVEDKFKVVERSRPAARAT